MKHFFGRNQVLGKKKKKKERKKRKRQKQIEKKKKKDGGLNYGLTVWKFHVEYSA